MKKYIRKNLLVVMVFLLVLLIENSASILVQFLKGDLLNLALDGDVSETLYKAMLLLGAILIETMFMYFEFISTNKFNYLCTKDLKEDVFKATLNKEYSDFNKNSIGEYIAKFTNEIKTINDAYFNSITLLVMLIIKILFVSCALICLNLKLAIVTLILLTMPLYIPKLAEKKLKKSQNNFLDTMEIFLEKLNDFFQGFEIIKNFSIENKIMIKFKIFNDNAMKTSYINDNTHSLIRIISACMSYFSYFIIVAFSAYLVLVGEFNAGQFFIAVNMIDQLSYPIISISGCIRSIISVKDLNDKITNYCKEEKIEIKNEDSLTTFQSKIEFKNICFSYVKDKPVLNHISMTFEKGKKYLIKGRSGFGKTTLVNLLLKYYRPNDGEIVIDDMSIEKINNIYDIVSVVRQDNFLFKDTLRNNLTLFEDIDDDRLFSILDSVNLHDFANKEALDMIIGSGGVSISGGEAKRISIARALLKGKDILILDEPLANLDKDTTEILENEILSLEKYTVIMISHVISKDAEAGFDGVYNFS